MLYMSDHGESLEENGIYLHAMPYQLAPSSQTNVPLIIWTGDHFDFSASDIKRYRDKTVSQDDLFCSLMAVFEIQTTTCDARTNLFMPEHMEES
jgi:lipid A ethanolaminephosphotransferase